MASIQLTRLTRFSPLAGIICFSLLTNIPLAVMSQTVSSPVLCGNELFGQMIKTHYPQLESSFHETFEQAKKTTDIYRGEILTVPVVFHVIYLNPEENIDDAILMRQLSILNRDFNHLNADSVNLRPPFVPVAGNAQIHFELAGIVRVETDKLFEIDLFGTDLLSDVKRTVKGGSDAWDPEHYLNIWICKIQPITIFGIEIGQLLGFSFPPNNLPNWPPDIGAPSPAEDGVVVDFRTVGDNNPNPIYNPLTDEPLVIKGRTPVHEVGHYLGLRHIWGDGSDVGPNDCQQSDGIDDTPFANGQSDFDCNPDKNTCPQVEDYYQQDMPDLIENYMDYASEDCMNMFTKGQVELMRGVLNGPRSGLTEGSAGIKRVAAANPLILSPNPAKEMVRITFPPGFQNGILQLSDMHGRLITRLSVREHQDEVMIRLTDWNLIPGCYVVSLLSQHEVSSQKLMINPR